VTEIERKWRVSGYNGGNAEHKACTGNNRRKKTDVGLAGFFQSIVRLISFLIRIWNAGKNIFDYILGRDAK